MKKWKKFLIVILCLTLVQAPVEFAAQPVTVQAASAVKNGPVTVKGKYYYYQNGKMVKSVWKQIRNRKYYFSRSGYAFAAPKISGMNCNILVKKIGSKYYGFDNKGCMVTGVHASTKGVLYVFDSKGVYSPSRSAKLRSAAKEGRSSATVRRLLGKPKRTRVSDSCLKLNSSDVTLTYGAVMIVLIKNKSTKRETVYCAVPR